MPRRRYDDDDDFLPSMRRNVDLKDIPMWSLNAEEANLNRKLEIALKKKKAGKPAHKTLGLYEENIRKKLHVIEKEIKRREKVDKDSWMPTK
jgi:hypothetical protein